LERVDGFSDLGIVVKILAKTVEGEQWGIKGKLYRELKRAFEQNHITMVPTQHVSLEKTPARRAKD
jgi:small-conductance mechanosensitive channel